jgi:hypothetical protein
LQLPETDIRVVARELTEFIRQIDNASAGTSPAR